MRRSTSMAWIQGPYPSSSVARYSSVWFVQPRWKGDARVVERQAFWLASRGTDAPDVRFFERQAVDEVDEGSIARPEGKVVMEACPRNMDLSRRDLLVETPSRTRDRPEPAGGARCVCRRATSRARRCRMPFRNGRSAPPIVGMAHPAYTTPPRSESGTRLHNVTSVPSGEKPTVRVAGFRNSGTLPLVRL